MLKLYKIRCFVELLISLNYKLLHCCSCAFIVSLILFCKPFVFLCIEACCLVPGITVNVADHPYIAHFIAGCNNLLMVVAICDVACTALCAFEYVVTDEASTEALWLVELIIVNLRLRMVVGRIA